MLYNLVIKEEARKDMLQAYEYYEEEQQGLGERFLSAVEDRLKSLSKHPQYYSYIDSQHTLRDVTLEHFPFVIVYEMTSMEVIVYAVCSTYKQPKRNKR